MPSHDYRRALTVATEAAARAAAMLLAECDRPGGPRGPRGKCPADDEAELVIRRLLAEAFPTWGFRGEETGYQPPAEGETHIWVVDPNDGTVAMQQGRRGHAVSIGLLRDRVPLLGVVHAVNAPDDDGDVIAWAEGCGPLSRNGVPLEREPWPAELRQHDVVLLSQGADRHPHGNLPPIAPARYRNVPSVAYRLALAAAGEGAVAVSLHTPGAVDYAGAHALLRGVGGMLVDESGAEVSYTLDAQSQTRRCFGGPPGLVQRLAQRPWERAFPSGMGEAVPPPGFEPARLSLGDLVHDVGVLRRAQGCLLGQVAGDSLGALVEFRSSEAIAADFRDGGPRLLADGGPHGITAGQGTDDSELALMLARSLVQYGRFDPEAAANAYARWFHGWTHRAEPERCGHSWCQPFDVGNTIATALAGITPAAARRNAAATAASKAALQDSQANGALMRVSPLGIWGWKRDPAQVAEAARADARLTHPHPLCQDASAVFAVTIAHAIRDGTDAHATYHWALAWGRDHVSEPSIVAVLEQASSGPPEGFDSWKAGWVLIALQNAFYQLLHAPSVKEGVVASVRQGGDTDTNAAICGALLGAVYGRDAVPFQWRQMVLSCRPMPGYEHIRRPRPALFWPADALTLAERLLVSSQ